MTAPLSKALGTTHDVNELVPGHVDHTRGIAEDLGKEAERVGEMYHAFHAVRVENWAGESYAAWETAVEVETAKWKSYLSLLTTAQGAISSYADSLETAQSRGQTAIDTWDEAEQKTEDAVNAYNEAIRDYNRDVEDCVAGARPPAEFSDPGEALRLEAQEILTEARSDLDGAGQAALVRLGMLEGGNTASSTEVTGSEVDATGPSFSWEAWGEQFGRDPIDGEASEGGVDASGNDEADPRWELQLGQVEGSIFAVRQEASYQDYVLGGNVLVSANGSYTIGGVETHASIGVNEHGLAVAVGVSVNAFSADGQLSASTWLMEGEVSVAAVAGAHAAAEVTIGPTGVHAEGEVFAGVEVDFGGSIEMGGLGAEGNAGFSAGIGAEGDLNLGMHDGQLTMGGSIGLALGPGLELGFAITVDPGEVAETIQSGSGWFMEGIWDMGQTFAHGGRGGGD